MGSSAAGRPRLYALLLSIFALSALAGNTVENKTTADQGQPTTATPAVDVPLDRWQGILMPIIKNLALLDLTLPGTHDSLTADLSEKTSAGALDGHPNLSFFLREFPLTRLVAGKFIKKMAVAQSMQLIDQLNNGLRFIDLRLMREPNGEWRSLHWLQSNRLFMDYARDLRAWLDAHPTEVVIIELSRHGQECAKGEEQFPGVTIEQKRGMWGDFVELFSGLLLDTTVSSVGETPMADLIARGHRVAVYACDYEEFTGKSKYAYNLCGQTAWSGPGGPETALAGALWKQRYMTHARAMNEANRKANKLAIMGLATPVTPWQVEYLAWMDYWPFSGKRKEAQEACAAKFVIPDLNDWCPDGLVPLTRLNNYYHQAQLHSLMTDMTRDLPPAVAVDRFAPAGHIEVGENGETSAFVDILIEVTARRACDPAGPHYARAGADPAICNGVRQTLKARVDAAPPKLWDDTAHGRHTDWPNIV